MGNGTPNIADVSMMVEESISKLDQHEKISFEDFTLTREECLPLVDYLVENSSVPMKQLMHDLFYFKPGLRDYIHRLGRFKAAKLLNWHEPLEKQMVVADRGLMAAVSLISRSRKNEDSFGERVSRAAQAAELFESWYVSEPLIALESAGGMMPYAKFLKIGGTNSYYGGTYGCYNRLKSKKHGLLDFGYEGDEQTAYITDRGSEIIRAIFGPDIVKNYREEILPSVLGKA